MKQSENKNNNKKNSIIRNIYYIRTIYLLNYNNLNALNKMK